ncbi:hypothetical protein K432DRAFT_430502 [Lepidopterella palustris CBS 459.81]|uniref:Uncharacterized protein n=1 Tax=Lepidopterella palustris CBS 459.81 TaxID=1314670 RepID=A0A8E2J8T3_9PEZI|nr:hypothetical protein K432DRAFT_430502 [Lepidopterella palustris CBS 459.81]
MDRSQQQPQRVILHICVTDLPGSPQNRHNVLGNAFCQQILKRAFNNKLQTSKYDYMHLPPNFDTDKSVRRWFVLDLDVNCRLEKDEVLALHHQVYFVSRQNNEWVFIPRPQYLVKAKDYCTTYCWGGRQEQDIVEKMRTQGLSIEEALGIPNH